VSVVPLHPRHRSAAEYSRALYPQPIPDADQPAVREFLLRRQIAFECKRRTARPFDQDVAKRMALAAMRAGASANLALRVALRYLDIVAPRARSRSAAPTSSPELYMSRIPIRLRHPATSDVTLIVKTIRMDVPPGEPHSLQAEQHLLPGQEITAWVYTGGGVLITEAPSNEG